MQPVIIEVALNGACKKSRNPHTPIMPDEIAADASRCVAAGAQSVHTHIERVELNGEAAARRYLEAWAPVHAAHPGVLFYPTIAAGSTIEQRASHVEELAKSGILKFAPLDPGSLNYPGPGAGQDGLPSSKSVVYSHSYAD